MEGRNIIIALRHDSESRILTASFKAQGFGLKEAADGARALEMAVEDPPALIIADVDLPVVSGERLFQILRNNPHTSGVPFLFVSGAVTDIKGFRTGFDIFLLRPLNVEELNARVRQTLSRKPPEEAARKEIEGRLQQMSLADILQFLHLSKKEGELRLGHADKAGRVYIKDGHVLNAVLDGVEREKALFRMLAWVDGKFEFVPMKVDSERKIKSTTGNLLMEGMRQMDEFRKHSAEFPDNNAALQARVGEEALPKGLQPVIYEIIRLVGSHPRVEDLVERCSATDYDVYRTIASMLSRGILAERKAGGENGRAEFLTPDQAISIREKILGRFTGMHNLNHGKIFVVATSGRLVTGFLGACSAIPGFTQGQRSAFAQIAMENPLGTVGTLRLYGGMDLNIFSIPTVKSMGPLWKAFSSNLVGLVLLWDDEGGGEIKELMGVKREILLGRRVPVVHVFAGAKKPDDGAAHYRKALGLKADEPLFVMDSGAVIFDIFYSLFGNLVKDDYVA